MSARDGRLSWHRDDRNPMGLWKAWAISLDPQASLPPYYVLRTLSKGRPERKVLLVWCRSCEGGPKTVDVGEADDFLTAKAMAQADYEKRMATATAT